MLEINEIEPDVEQCVVRSYPYGREESVLQKKLEEGWKVKHISSIYHVEHQTSLEYILERVCQQQGTIK